MIDKNIRVVELFAGVGGFRIGLEGASDAYQTVWNNQWEPSTKHQDASLVYRARFGNEGHSNNDICTIATNDIPDHDLLVGGFPCQDYSVAATLSRSGGIEGKKGVLWWQIYRILEEKGEKRPNYIFLENVDRLINSPATQRGRDFAIILASLWKRVYFAQYTSWQCAQRIPGTLFATIDTPMPEEHTTIPLSHSPLATASAASTAKSG
jgi:DNA (cytosine-5)-methyltransferase 1